jgi:hypothetical protein
MEMRKSSMTELKYREAQCNKYVETCQIISMVSTYTPLRSLQRCGILPHGWPSEFRNQDTVY